MQHLAKHIMIITYITCSVQIVADVFTEIFVRFLNSSAEYQLSKQLPANCFEET